MLDGSIVGILLLGSGTVYAEASADHAVDLSVNATLEVDTILIIAFVDTLLLVVTYAEVVVDVLTAAAYCEVVVLLAAVLCHHVGPVVGVAAGQHLLHLVVAGANVLTKQTLLEDRAADLIDRM